MSCRDHKVEKITSRHDQPVFSSGKTFIGIFTFYYISEEINEVVFLFFNYIMKSEEKLSCVVRNFILTCIGTDSIEVCHSN